MKEVIQWTAYKKMIDVLSKFCDDWGLSVNMDKTKILVFRRGGRIKKNEVWFYKGVKIDIVPHYKYVGVLVSSFLSWSLATKTLSLQGTKALNILNCYGKKCNGLPVKCAFELFDRMILPILLYGSEIWGYGYYKAIESVQIKFCKQILGLPRKTSNEAVLGECGRYPLMLHYNYRCIKYWLKILNMSTSRYPRACYEMLYSLDECGRTTWATSIKEILNTYGFGIVWLQQGVGDCELFLTQFKNSLQESLRQNWATSINNSSKLSVYCTYKSILEAESYLTVLNVPKYRSALARFRCSGHTLAIESGRYDNITLENRICTFCEKLDITVLEDEYHVLLFCPTFQSLREQYIDRKFWEAPTFQLFRELMSTCENGMIKSLSCFIYKSENLRRKLLQPEIV